MAGLIGNDGRDNDSTVSLVRSERLTGRWRGGVRYVTAAIAVHQAVGAEAAQEPTGPVVAALAVGLLAPAALAGDLVPGHLEPLAESLDIPVFPPFRVPCVVREGVSEHGHFEYCLAPLPPIFGRHFALRKDERLGTGRPFSGGSTGDRLDGRRFRRFGRRHGINFLPEGAVDEEEEVSGGGGGKEHPGGW